MREILFKVENGDIRRFSQYEVKGNVFDNPELLEGAQP